MDAAVRRWVVAAAWTAAVAGLCAQSPAPSGVISGRVVIRGESPVAPIRRARVTLDGDAGQRTTNTDTDGRYRFTGLAPGAYRVSAAKSGFVTLFAGSGRAFVTPPPIVLKAGEARTVDLALPRGAALEGRITDADGDPIENVIVGVSRLVPGARGMRPVSIAEDWTDDLGRYRLHSLPTGAYQIQTGTSSALGAGVATVVDAMTESYARTYYPGTINIGEAQAVRVVLGEERPGLDFTMQTGRASNVSIQVVDASGKPVSSFGCRLQAVGSHVYQDGWVAPRQARCALNQIPPGDYWAMARAGTTGAGPVGYAVSRIQIGGDGPHEVVLTVDGVAEIKGSVEADEPSAWSRPTGLRVDALATLYDLPSAAGEDELRRPHAAAPAIVGADGGFSLSGVFGPTVFRLAGLPAGWALQSVWLDGDEMTDREANVAASPQPRRLRMLVTNRTGKISGTIVGDVQSPLSGDTRVVIFAADDTRWNATSRFIATATPGRDGRFSAEGLLPASYLVAVSDDLDDDAWLDPAELRQLARGAAPVVVAAGDTAKVSVRMGGAR